MNKYIKMPKWLKNQGKYRKTMITILLFVSLPGFAIGFALLWFVSSQVESELQYLHEDQLFRTAATIEEQFSNIEQFLAHMAFSPSFSEQLQQLDFRYDFEEVHELYGRLLMIEGSNPLFKSVELYIGNPRPVVISESGYRYLDEMEAGDTYAQLLDEERNMYWSNSLSLIHKLPGATLRNQQPFGALMVHLDQQSVLNLLSALSPYSGGETVLFSEGELMIRDRADVSMQVINPELLEHIMASEQETGSLLQEHEEGTFVITYGTFQRLGQTWLYVSAAPLSAITNPVVVLSKLILTVNLVLLILSLLFVWFASNRLYSPIENLLSRTGGLTGTEDKMNEFERIEKHWENLSRESRVLQSSLDQNLPHLREGFLMQLLQGYMYPYTEQELQDRLGQVGFETEDRRFIVMLIQLIGFSKLEGRFSEGDEGLVTFAAANIVEEVLADEGKEASVINFHDLTIGILIGLPVQMDQDSLREELHRLSVEIMERIQKIIPLQSTIVISRDTKQLQNVAVLYEECKHALGFRVIRETNQIIDLEQLDEQEREYQVKYPFEIEKEIVYAIRLGDAEKAVEHIRSFVADLSRNHVSEALMRQGLNMLLGNVLRVILQSGVSANQFNDGADLYDQLGQIRDTEEIPTWFKEQVLDPFIHEWSQKKDQHLRQTVERTLILLNERYNSDISLDYCADEVGLSPDVLSKAFKKVTGLNFIDYLTQLRLEKAKQLLRETGNKISQVAEEVGYQPSYFNRLFKKHEGMTPSQYREKWRE